MASNQTPTYGLNQWVLSDSVRMEEFNEDNLKTEQALLALKNEFKADDAELEEALLAVKNELKADDAKIEKSLLALTDKHNADKAKTEASLLALEDEFNSELEESLLTLKNEFKADDAEIKKSLPKFKSGSYVGTGTYGESAPNSLTFTFEPQLFIVAPQPVIPGSSSAELAKAETLTPLVAIRGAATATVAYDSNMYGSSFAPKPVALTWSGKTVSWYGKQEITQYNAADVTYRYLAIG